MHNMRTTQEPLLKLNFWRDDTTELVSSSFTHPLLERTHEANRGRGRSAFRGSGSFEWTKAVQALVVLLLRSTCSESESADLIGGRASLASSLDYAIDKQPEWMADMFGSDSEGNTLLRRAIIRSNSGRKRVGPVALSLNRLFLSPASIRISLNSEPVTEANALLQLTRTVCGQIETGHEMGSSPTINNIGLASESASLETHNQTEV